MTGSKFSFENDSIGLTKGRDDTKAKNGTFPSIARLFEFCIAMVILADIHVIQAPIRLQCASHITRYPCPFLNGHTSLCILLLLITALFLVTILFHFFMFLPLIFFPIGLAVVYVRFKQIAYLHVDSVLDNKCLNMSSLICGILSGTGLMLVANFQVINPQHSCTRVMVFSYLSDCLSQI